MEQFLEENIYIFDIYNNDEIEYADLNSIYNWIWNEKHKKYYRFLSDYEYNFKLQKYNTDIHINSYNCGIAMCNNYLPCLIHPKDKTLSFGCVPCNYDIYNNIPYDKYRFKRNEKNNHCFICTCKICVCSMITINGQYKNKIIDNNLCNINGNCNNCYNLMEKFF